MKLFDTDPATTREQHARRRENLALAALDEALAGVRQFRRELGGHPTDMLLVSVALATAVAELEQADLFARCVR